MAIPGFQRMMLPILELCRADVPVSTADLSAKIADHFNLSEEDRSVTIAPGRLRYKNRVSWAVGQLSGAGLLEKVADGEYRITESGKEVLARPPERLDLKFLARFPAWVEFRRTRSAEPDDEASFPSRVGRTRLNLRIPTALVKKAKVHSALNPSIQLQDMVSEGLELYFAQPSADSDEHEITHDVDDEQGVQTPNEILDRAYQTLRKSLAQDLLEKVKQASPVFFERLVVDLLLKMGYGGSRPDAGSVTRRGADGGIDGLIKEDKLGLDVIYIQAKRWSATVGRPEIQAFAGSLEGNRAKKGVFMTTSQFSSDAKDYVAHIEKKIVLIDGAQLSEMMIDHDVGVSVGETYAVRRIDSDYFSEE